MNAALMDGFHHLAGDPDAHLGRWTIEGAPLGIDEPITPSGIFPPAGPQGEARSGDRHRPNADPQGWTNYRSAEDDLPTCALLLQRMVKKGWAKATRSLSTAQAWLGEKVFPLNRLGLISKLRPDGTYKHRLIWDLRRSWVNDLINQGERVILPRLQDAIADASALALTHGGGGTR